MDDTQIYKIKGLSNNIEAEELLDILATAGYYQCSIDATSSELHLPLAYASYIDDIEEILLDMGYEFLDD